ncbi:MAG TPA: PQQ-dependent sugar dehydrogenase [Planctomycetota bacterium]|nr:PQQ-dependent sugar dehydrogenase [Planctomycetota bacterium]
MRASASFLLVVLAVSTCSGEAAAPPTDLVHAPPKVLPVAPPAVALAPAFGDLRFQRPLDAAQAPGDPKTWYVVEQRGLIFRVSEGASGWVAEPWLDIRNQVSRKGNEEGLLGLAFSPHYATTGHPHEGAFYANYSVKTGERRSRLSRFRAEPGRDAVDPGSEELLLEVAQPYENHNGGGLVFGPDGYLYYSLGDGGAAGDPAGNSQDVSELLGSILRLDVAPRSDGRPYGVPADNPLVGRAGACPEIWAYGLRNPWRFCFDRETGELWTGDVGQNAYEFVHVVRKGGNHGWDLLEGFHRFELPAGEQPPEPLVPPVFEYSHDDGLSITGGFVYRGQAIPELVGWYVFGDYVTKKLWAIRRAGEGRVEHMALLRESVIMSSFAEDADGELLLVEHLGQGQVWRLVKASAPAGKDSR